MADKFNITVDAQALLPAVTHTKMQYSALGTIIAQLRKEINDAMADGLFSGQRAAAQKELAEAIQKTCGDMVKALDNVAVNNDQILQNYISLEGQAAVQRMVAQAAESLGGENADKLKGAANAQ